MDQLFRVDRVARETGLTLETRHALRSEESRPILERIKVSIEAAQIGALPQSARTKAREYTLKLWNRLTRFLVHPELELSNNAAENSMRPVAIGGNNRIHVGSEQAGPRVAAVVLIVETSRGLRIPVRVTGVLVMGWVQRNNESTREARSGGERDLNWRSARIRAGRAGMTERSVVARKRVTIVERRDLSSRATQEAARAGRLT